VYAYLFPINQDCAAFSGNAFRVNRRGSKETELDSKSFTLQQALPQQLDPLLSLPASTQAGAISHSTGFPVNTHCLCALQRHVWKPNLKATFRVLAPNEFPPLAWTGILCGAELLDISGAFSGTVHAGHPKVSFS
jgi:hypothetical protein